MTQHTEREKRYKEAAIIFSICSLYYLLIFLWKGISISYGYIYFIAVALLIFLIAVVPYFVYKGSKIWALTLAWIYVIRAAGGTWHIYTGMGHEIEKYTLISLYICCFILFRAAWGDKTR